MKMRRRLTAWGGDLLDAMLGRHDPDVPPRRYQRVGRGDFRQRGDELAAILLENGLGRGQRVLDIGCGIGRVALGLTRAIPGGIDYDGFDANGRAIEWCVANITPRHPSFRFVRAEVAAGTYNPVGAPAEEYRFPWPDETFDFAFATSVFTHLPYPAASHYFSEARRVLRPGGVLFATVFEVDDPPSKLGFVDRGRDFVRRPSRPTGGTGFSPAVLRELLPERDWSSVALQRGDWRETGSFGVLGQDRIRAQRS
jgi:SAM-dependent methyltransferase